MRFSLSRIMKLLGVARYPLSRAITPGGWYVPSAFLNCRADWVVQKFAAVFETRSAWC